VPPAIIGGVIAGVGAVGAAAIGSGAAGRAADASAAATQATIAEQRAAREQLRKLLQPWVGGGNEALQQQMQLLGLNGIRNQRAAVQGIENSPMFRALAAQGEDAILQNASATGGLRGGNTQGALAQFRPALLNQQIQQQYANLTGLSQLGQASAAGVGQGGQLAAGNIGNAIMGNATNQGNAAIAQGNQWNNAFGQIGGIAGNLIGQGAFGGGFGGGVSAPVLGNANIAMPDFGALSGQVGQIQVPPFDIRGTPYNPNASMPGF